MPRLLRRLALRGPGPMSQPWQRSRGRRTSILVSVLALGLLGSTTRTADAIVPIPPRPFLNPSAPRGVLTPHPSAEICEQPGVRCPDLAMRPPYGFRPDVYEGRRMLRAANAVLSIGPGPAEVRARRTSPTAMAATQYVRRRGLPSLPVPGGAGRVVFVPIPGQGRIWKFEDAARFQLWSRGADPKLVRVGEKLDYCLRDLRRLWDWRRSPRREVYPACSRNPKRTKVTLGTSPGWSDIYPTSYYDQWIDVSGLRGCFDLVHIADPGNHLVETDETNNEATTRVRLPMGKRHVSRC